MDLRDLFKKVSRPYNHQSQYLLISSL
jgi:hypothetical protein